MMRRKSMLSVLLTAAMMCTLFTGCGQDGESGGGQAADQKGSQASEGKESPAAESEGEQDSAAEDGQDAAQAGEDSGAEGEAAGSGAGEGFEEFGRISEDTITLSLAARYVAGQYTTDFASTDQFKEYEKRLGIRFDVSAYDLEQWPSKLTLMMASDEMPDLIAYADMSSIDVEKYGKDGYLLDFSQYLDIMPNLKKRMEEYPEYEATITSENGSIYAFSTLTASSEYSMVRPIYLSKKWLDNLNLEEPKTLEEFYNVLKAFKEQDANGNGDPTDEIPMGRADTVFWPDMPILWSFGIFGQSEAYYLMPQDDNAIVLGDTTENYKAYLHFMRKLYEEGLMNVDAFVTTYSEVDAKHQDDKVGYWQTWSSLPGDVKDWIVVNGFTTEYNPVQTNVIYNRAYNKYHIAASADTEHPEEVARFVDYLFTYEGAISAISGYEGVSFDLVEEDGVLKIDYEPYAEAAGFDDVNDFYAQRVIAANVFPIYQVDRKGGLAEVMKEMTWEELHSDAIYEMGGTSLLRELAIREEGVEVIYVYPSVKYTAEELGERSTLYTDVYNYLVTAKVQFITGETDIDAGWDAYLAELDKIGLERLLEIEQAAYDRYLGN